MSPAYDINPTPIGAKARILSLAIDEADDSASLDVTLGMARHCRAKLDEAREIIGEASGCRALAYECSQRPPQRPDVAHDFSI